MRKLLNAEFCRLAKDKVFWFSSLFMLLMGLYTVYMRYQNEPSSPPDQVFFFHTVAIGFLLAAFCGLFIGAEHSDGTIRNKLIVGHTRVNVYLSNFVICACAGIAMSLVNIAAVAALGVSLLGPVSIAPLSFAYLIFTSLMLAVAFASLGTCIGICVASRSKALVIMLLGVVALFVIAILFNTRLEQPEFYDNYVYTNSLSPVLQEPVPNPNYMTGMPRVITQFMLDFLPSGQAIELSSLSANSAWLPLYSFIIAAVSTFIGLFIFRKKDIK